MSYPKTERQAEIVALAERLAARFAPRAAEHDRENTFPFENVREMHESGYLSLTIPRAYGGCGADPLELALAQERLARGCGATALLSTMHLSLLGREGEARTWPEPVFARICRVVVEEGALVNNAASEPDLGSPSRGGLPSTTATRTEAGWMLDRRKRWVSLAPALSFIFVMATVVDGEAAPRRGTFLVPADTPGVRVEPTWDNLGMRATASDDVVFERVALPPDALLDAEPTGRPDPGSGWSIFPTAAVYLGIAQAARDAAVAYARERRPNGMAGPIAELQTVQHKVAEIELLLWQSRAVLYPTAERWVAARREDRAAMEWELAAIKYTVTNSAIRVTDLALRVVGSASLSRALPLERHFRDARAGLGHPPMDDAALTAIGKAALGLTGAP